MWRHLTRGLQQSFKRSLCFEKPDVCVKEGKASASHHNCCITELLPSAFQNLNSYVSKRGGDQYQRDDYEKTSRNISHHTFLEAFGWSGALVFGWVISKQIWLKQTWPRDQDLHNNRSNVNHLSFFQLLAHLVKAQPPVKFVLPQLHSEQTYNTNEPTKTKDIGSKLSNLDDEFETAAKQLAEIHEKAIGEALNRRGLACLSKSSGTEAITCFQRASSLKYPPASFNMGQCCELGIGTKQDFQQAAKWYRIAVEQGHATAMYNLGVFYAHGWGGLQADIDTAKKLFVEAANLGQPNARAALDKESKSTAKLIYKANSSQVSFINRIETKPVHMKSELNFFENNLRNELSSDVFQQEFKPKNQWNIPLNSTVAF